MATGNSCSWLQFRSLERRRAVTVGGSRGSGPGKQTLGSGLAEGRACLATDLSAGILC